MVFDLAYPNKIDPEKFPKRDWNNFYGKVDEQLRSEVILRLFVDADYADDGSNRRSRTGFIIFMTEAQLPGI